MKADCKKNEIYMTLNKELKHFLLNEGATKVGFADISEIPKCNRNNLNYGIIIVKVLNPNIVSLIKEGPSIEYTKEYNKVNKLLNELAEKTADLLIIRGFKALPKTQDKVIFNNITKSTDLPYKTIATRAGIGWIGKCALLITEEYGSAIRISSVLTNAELEVGKPINISKCNNCVDCVNICPGKAITGKLWKKGIEREKIFSYDKCNETIKKRGEIIGTRHGSCGLCIYICPWTQKYLRRMRSAIT